MGTSPYWHKRQGTELADKYAKKYLSNPNINIHVKYVDELISSYYLKFIKNGRQNVNQQVNHCI